MKRIAMAAPDNLMPAETNSESLELRNYAACWGFITAKLVLASKQTSITTKLILHNFMFCSLSSALPTAERQTGHFQVCVCK